MKIEELKLKDLHPYPRNSKKHDRKQIEQVANSIKRFGFIQPLVVDKNNEIVIGHCRYESAKLLEMEKVPCVKVENLTKKEIQTLRIADNKLNESKWDMSLVIPELKGLDVDLLDLTGFDKDLLIELDEKDDIIPENVPAKTKIGDLYEIGDHRILCGDSTNKLDIEKVMGG